MAKTNSAHDERAHAFRAPRDLRPKELVEALRADFAAWVEGAEQSDDVTILVLEYKGES